MNNLLGHSPKILIIGDLMIDHYLWGSCERISPEAPVQVVSVKTENLTLGGAGNVIKNLSTLGARVDVISVIGDCETSKKLIEMLKEIRLDTKFLIRQKDRITSRKSRIISDQQQVIRYDRESTDEISDLSQSKIIQTFKEVVSDYDLILLSDYGKGVLSFNLTQSLISIANTKNKKILVDPKGVDFSKYKGAYLITPNKKEASEATHIEIQDEKSLNDAIKKLKQQLELNVSVITLSEQGIAVFDNELRIHPTVAKEVFDVTGAGDTVLASLGFALSFDNDIDEAIKFANLASGVVVGKIGSASASIDEIVNYEKSLNHLNSQNCIKTWSQIIPIVSKIKSSKQKIVFTNGCFDILHVGHIKYLEKAKEYGDILILGLNSDSSVKKLKGNNRPINNENDRAQILASLNVIDYVVIFHEDTPLELIELIEPDVLVKGSDYEGKEIAGEKIAKKLKLIKFIDGKSTTETINRIKNS